MRLQAVVWIKERRIGSLEIQIGLGGDPSVLRFFDSRFLVDEPPDFAHFAIYSATENEWAEFARSWAKQEPLNRETTLHLH
jgi:hypothetical protein